jgi:peptidoglycan/LPS O-acetylase OafA/YrhL
MYAPPRPRSSEAPTPTPPRETTWRIGAVDLLRAVVCLSVVAWHAAAAWVAEPGPAYELAGQLRPGVECFLLLSGFFLAHTFRPSGRNRLSVARFLARRVLRLAAPYWVAVGLFTLFTATAYLYTGRDVSWPFLAEFLSRLLFVSDLVGYDQPPLVWSFYWSMISLFQFYILWAALFWVTRRALLAAGRKDFHEGAVSMMTVAAGVVFVVSGVGLLTGRVHTLQGGGPAGWMLPTAALYLAAGAILYQAFRRAVGPAVLVALLVSLVALGVAASNLRPVWAAAAGAGLFWLARSGPAVGVRGFGWLSAIGHRSFSIYLVHGLVLAVLDVACRHLGLPVAGYWESVVIVLAVGLSVGAGFVFYRLVEAPLAGAARRVEYRA